MGLIKGLVYLNIARSFQVHWQLDSCLLGVFQQITIRALHAPGIHPFLSSYVIESSLA